MLKNNFIILTITLILSQISFSFSAEKFLSLKKNKVNVRYGPSFDFPVKYIYEKKNLPIKQIDKKENFRRIIDYKKNSGWIHISQLSKKKSGITIQDAILYKRSTVYSKPLAKIETGRLLLISKCKDEWCKAKTNDYKGWVKKESLWGLL